MFPEEDFYKYWWLLLWSTFICSFKHYLHYDLQKEDAHLGTKNYNLFTLGGVLAETRSSMWESRTPSARELKWFVCGHKLSEGSPTQGFHTHPPPFHCFSLGCLLPNVTTLSLVYSFSFTKWQSMPTVKAFYPRNTACFLAMSMDVHLASTRIRMPELALLECLLSSWHYADISLNW